LIALIRQRIRSRGGLIFWARLLPMAIAQAKQPQDKKPRCRPNEMRRAVPWRRGRNYSRLFVRSMRPDLIPP